MNEELHSTNEELQTMNDELRSRTLELNETNAFLNSILSSLQDGVIVVDRQFRILSWNEAIEELWGLRSDEVLEESLLGLDIGLPVSQLREPIRSCLNNDEKQQEHLNFKAISRRGKPLNVRVRLSPLLGHDIEIRGVILYIEASDRSESKNT
jgi:two-component system CheB/CheR fusion protein